MDIINTHTGKIYVDREHQLEFLTVGDYGNENRSLPRILLWCMA